MAVDQALFDTLKAQFGDRVVRVELAAVDPWVEVVPEAVAEICRALRDDRVRQFDMLNCISAVDYLHTDPKKAAKATWEPHLALVYHLSSTVTKQTCVLKAKLSRWKQGVEGELPEIPSVCGVWPGANWHEREVYDLMGVRFVGHPDLRRILCPEDWVGHPLRKDYSFPESYHGIRDH
ncbi:MAG: NADH-quinone oxidoreductase subunit C [Pirellulaceae bacterium]